MYCLLQLFCISSRNFSIFRFCIYVIQTQWQIQGGVRDAYSHESKMSFIFMQFFFAAKIVAKYYVSAYQDLGLAAPSRKSWISLWIRVLDRVSYQYMFWRPCLRLWNKNCIPVGCVPTASVASTRYQYHRGLPAERGLPPSWHPTHPVNRLTDRRLWKHYLPLRSVINSEIIRKLISHHEIEVLVKET